MMLCLTRGMFQCGVALHARTRWYSNNKHNSYGNGFHYCVFLGSQIEPWITLNISNWGVVQSILGLYVVMIVLWDAHKRPNTLLQNYKESHSSFPVSVKLSWLLPHQWGSFSLSLCHDLFCIISTQCNALLPYMDQLFHTHFRTTLQHGSERHTSYEKTVAWKQLQMVRAQQHKQMDVFTH